MRKMTTAILLCALAGCLEPRIEPTVSTTEQLLCAIQDQAAGNCPGQEGCTPLDYCAPSNLEDGSCCINNWHPKTSTVLSVHCSNDPGQIAYCHKHEVFDFGIIAINCLTVTQWLTGSDGNVYQDVQTSCYLI